MNKFFKIGLVAVAVTLAGCQESAAEQAKVELNTDDQKAAYAIGASMAQYLAGSLDQQQELGLTLDRQLVLSGVTDGLTDESKLSQEEMGAILKSFEERVTKLASEKHQALMEKQKVENAAWLAEMEKQDGVIKTDSGLMYKVITQGDGAKPTAADTVTVHYRGTLPNGEEFDSSYERKETISFPLNGVIAGWTEGLQLMPTGSKYELYIPSELAYGERGAGQMIGPNMPLKFEVELFSINDQGAE